ncbi:hypothetical protein LCGC14_1931680 [marine sediment metagenome]|uniref:Transglycosylase SLT domain-containing protein n=1 Tax=marine sediment metagenome TaxID=412755 RepID=A0A0F9GB79_9ZZZZ
MHKQSMAFILLTSLFWGEVAYGHGLPSFTELIEAASPAVVKIEAVQAEQIQSVPQLRPNDIPKIFQDLFERYSKRNHIDVTWSIAISRRESSFAPDARSHANARGLMQLLPSTAKYVNKGTVSGARLNQANTNIRLGTEYLEYLKKKNRGNEVLATASYNAGYHRIKKWLPDEAMPAELWIELIPYRETREYVKNVYAYRQVYHTRLGREGNILAPILDMKMGG